MCPPLSVVSVVKVKQEQRVVKIKEGKPFIQLRGCIHRQMQVVIRVFVRLVELSLELFLCVLIWNISQHHVCSLVLARLYCVQKLIREVFRLVALELRVRAVGISMCTGRNFTS